jgi:hypothetical protein
MEASLGRIPVVCLYGMKLDRETEAVICGTSILYFELESKENNGREQQGNNGED